MIKKLIYVISIITMLSCSTKNNLSKKDLNLSEYHKHGYLDNRNKLDSIISAYTNQDIDSNKPLIIIYYPGKDPCNSSGSSTRKSTRNWFNRMEKGIDKIEESNLVYVYKDSTGLYGRHDGFKVWIKDPHRIVERIFFTKNPPCGGYTVISKNGEYLSLLMEISRESLWTDLEYLTN